MASEPIKQPGTSTIGESQDLLLADFAELFADEELLALGREVGEMRRTTEAAVQTGERPLVRKATSLRVVEG